MFKIKDEELFPVIEKLDLEGKDLRIFRNLHWDQTTSVRIKGEHSGFKSIKRVQPSDLGFLGCHSDMDTNDEMITENIDEAHSGTPTENINSPKSQEAEETPNLQEESMDQSKEINLESQPINTGEASIDNSGENQDQTE
ncbi:hypothetical protein PoB_001201000 [Plakobranchus ocellatus]|uniref:Uncharacterized protein n=1 Tax=Plakobranchus ocellatus TaxID=259542 RepID=A0AAV3YQU7_9GAST|nr:hypothetical protein PoB_001201000 [Plakobranchus ocellatus]